MDFSAICKIFLKELCFDIFFSQISRRVARRCIKKRKKVCLQPTEQKSSHVTIGTNLVLRSKQCPIELTLNRLLTLKTTQTTQAPNGWHHGHITQAGGL